MPLGIYISVPFCRTKCTYCNFASDVFPKAGHDNYVARLEEEIASAERAAHEVGGVFERDVDSVYLGGGTPSILDSTQLMRIFATLRADFDVSSAAEVTVECAPGTLSDALIETLLRCGVNRVSLGVQSFVDKEAASVGRLHKRATVLDEIARLRAAGIKAINVDLIAGLPHQTAESWSYSLAETIATEAQHVSVYMLEIDDDSRLGRELIAGGTRYHAHFVPDEEATADFYMQACETLSAAGISQYEISNFARAGSESLHNLKYWTRQPYFGFGVDAHSMLRAKDGPVESIRFATPDSLDAYLNRTPLQVTTVSPDQSLEECFFLGLRLNRGVNFSRLSKQFGAEMLAACRPSVQECVDAGLLEECATVVRLTPRGRLLSNEVFARFVRAEATP
jgi:oxygen-independent coproporphyrinogen III oxidase